MGHRSKTRKIKFYSILLIAIFSIGYFLSPHNSTNTSEDAINTLRISFTHDPNTLDPRKGSDPVGSTVHFTLFDGLTRMNKTSTHEPSIAEKIDISSDGTKYTFHLREAKWSNGDPVIAEDFAFAWKSILEPHFPAPNAHLLYPIKNAELVKKGELTEDDLGIFVQDDKTLVITLERPTPYFLDLTSFCVLFPVPSKIAKKNPKWADQLSPQYVTNGPFSLNTWKFSNELIFEKNHQFWDVKSVKLDKIRATIIDNEMTALGLFNSGELHFMGAFLANIQTEWIPDLKKKGLLSYQPFGATKFVTFNLDSLPFKNRNIRLAFSHAINRQALIDGVTQFKEQVATGYVPPVMKNNTENEYFKDGDIIAARKFMAAGLKELGLKQPSDLAPIKYDYFNTSTEKKLAQALQQQWFKAFGIQVKLEESEFNVHMDKMYRRDYQFGQFMYIAQYNDQMNILDRFKVKDSPKNYPGWENPEYSDLLDKSAFAKTTEERLEILEKAEQIMLEDMPYTGLYHWGNIFMQSKHVHDFYISPVGSIHLIHTYVD